MHVCKWCGYVGRKACCLRSFADNTPSFKTSTQNRKLSRCLSKRIPAQSVPLLLNGIQAVVNSFCHTCHTYCCYSYTTCCLHT